MQPGLVEQVVAERFALGGPSARPDYVAMLVPDDDTASNNGKTVTRALRGRELNLELLRHPLVVIVEQRDPSAPGVVDTGMSGAAGAGILAPRQNSQPGVIDRSQSAERFFIRPVNHDDDLDI